MREFHVREELRNICEKYPVFSGKTISHATADECGRRGWAVRAGGDWIPTALGIVENEKPMPVNEAREEPTR